MQEIKIDLTEKKDEELLNYKKAAAYIDVAEITLRHMVMKGKISHYKMGKRVKFEVKDLKEWKAKHRVEVKPKNKKTQASGDVLPFDEGAQC